MPNSILTGLNVDPTSRSLLTNYLLGAFRRAGALAETYSRVGLSATNYTPTSQRANYTAIYLPQGTVVTNLTVQVGGSTSVTPTNAWMSLYDVNLNKLAVTADRLTTPLTTNTEATFALSTPYTVAADGIFYIGIVQVAATPANLVAPTGVSALYAMSPAVSFIDATNAPLTTPATAPAVALNTGGAGPIYAWVS